MTNEQLAALETALLRMKALGDAVPPLPWTVDGFNINHETDDSFAWIADVGSVEEIE